MFDPKLMSPEYYKNNYYLKGKVLSLKEVNILRDHLFKGRIITNNFVIWAKEQIKLGLWHKPY